ncbi:MAG: alanine racemase [Candidatus Delongbacteria bacterium]|nr:alanine racemase [Candidatus Delongbacteria bacterium]MBN2836270.1 alanine racemase [Candidatus Delongbacteria bacterium]
MAFVILDRSKLEKNYTYLDNLFKKNGIEWSIVSKLLCGSKELLSVLLDFNINQICDSRVSNLKAIKELNPAVETVYIKPPAKRSIKSIVKYADISMNTEFDTIEMLSKAAKELKKIHKIIIMIELGELREGVMRDDFIRFYEKVFELDNIEVIGIGTNLSCMYGVLPNHDKLIQLSLYEQLIEAKFSKHIKYVSGGSSVTIPLIFNNMLPKGINHFRVGETLFLGTDVYHDSTFDGMENDVFILYSEIIELIHKPNIPQGEMGSNVDGQKSSFDDNDLRHMSYRAIIDLGLLDVDFNHIYPQDDTLKIVGASSDMIVVNLGENVNNYKVGDLIVFRMDYMGTLRVLNSKYIGKRVK